MSNAGDLIYYFRFRAPLPASILNVPPPNGAPEWAIRLAGRDARGTLYEFGPVRRLLFGPTIGLPTTQIAGGTHPAVPAATADLAASDRISDEQALLARVRTAGLIQSYLAASRSVSYAVSFQNHKRTNLPDLGQIEIDELYVAEDRAGNRFIVPLQAKSRTEFLSAVQVEQDVLWCNEYLRPRGWTVVPLGLRAMSDPSAAAPVTVALIEYQLSRRGAVGPYGDVVVANETHFVLL